jgi:spermidine synthase
VEAVKSEVATFFQVFPRGTVWSNDVVGEGYDVVLLGEVDPRTINIDALQQRLDRDDHSRVRLSLKEVDFRSVISLLGTYAGREPDLRPWLKDAEINRDRNLRLQYLAGMGLDSFESYRIFDEILEYCTFPKDLFLGSELNKQLLRRILE